MHSTVPGNLGLYTYNRLTQQTLVCVTCAQIFFTCYSFPSAHPPPGAAQQYYVYLRLQVLNVLFSNSKGLNWQSACAHNHTCSSQLDSRQLVLTTEHHIQYCNRAQKLTCTMLNPRGRILAVVMLTATPC